MQHTTSWFARLWRKTMFESTWNHPRVMTVLVLTSILFYIVFLCTVICLLFIYYFGHGVVSLFEFEWVFGILFLSFINTKKKTKNINMQQRLSYLSLTSNTCNYLDKENNFVIYRIVIWKYILISIVTGIVYYRFSPQFFIVFGHDISHSPQRATL